MHLTWYFRHFHLFVHSFVFTVVVVDNAFNIRTPLTHNFLPSCRNKSDLQKALNFKCEKCSGLENERERIERHCDKVKKGIKANQSNRKNNITNQSKGN